MAKYVSQKLKKLVKKRANSICEYCQSQENFCPDTFSVEHIISKAKGGTTEEQNLAYSCQGCNNKKYDFISWIDPLTGNKENLYNPRKDNWNRHFSWNEDFTKILGLTPIGRATIDRIKLNREGVKNLRHALKVIGKHPPN